jgi:hypothetical protein
LWYLVASRSICGSWGVTPTTELNTPVLSSPFTLNFIGVARTTVSPANTVVTVEGRPTTNLSVAAEGAVAPGAGAEDDLAVQRRDGSADEWTDPEDPLHR